MTSAGSTSIPVFQFLDASIDSASPSLLGLWETTELPEEPLSFSTNVPASSSPQIWRANLPADVDQANLHLSVATARLDLMSRSLETVPERLERFAAEWRGESFSLAEASPAEQPEAELRDFLQEVEFGTSSTSFSLDYKIIGLDVPSALDRFLEFLNRLRDTLAKYAWVETSLGTRVIARTAVGWSGDFSAAWISGLASSEAAVHQRTLLFALKTRDVLARTTIIVAQAAVKISLLLSTPVTAPLALLAAYKFVRALIEQFQSMSLSDIQEIQHAK